MADTLTTSSPADAPSATPQGMRLAALAATVGFLLLAKPGMVAAISIIVALVVAGVLASRVSTEQCGEPRWTNLAGTLGAMSMALIVFISAMIVSPELSGMAQVLATIATAATLAAADLVASALLAAAIARSSGNNAAVAIASLISDRYFGLLGKTL